MMSITTKPLHIDLELKKKIQFVCSFCNTKPEIINGKIITIDLTNITYVEPHRIKIEGTTLLAFNYSNELYVEGLNKKIELKDLETILPNFKIASAIIHYDETSPHLHIVGVPIKIGVKNGMKKQVGKSDVFTKESLTKLQEKMRTLCIESFNKEYNLTNTLKDKRKGRNHDCHITEMDNYMEMKQQLEKNQTRLETANEKTVELDNHTQEINNVIDKLKPTLTSKDKLILKQEDKENHQKIKTLTENNKALFLRVISLIKNKLFGKEKEREKYFDVSKDLYAKGIIKDDTFEDMKETYIFSKEHDNRDKEKMILIWKFN